MSQGDYRYQFVAPGLALTLSLGFAAAFVWLPVRHWAVRLLIFAACSVPLYYVSCGAYLVGVAAVVIAGAYKRRHYAESIGCVLIAAIIPYFAPDIFIITSQDAYAFLLPWGEAMPPGSPAPKVLFLFVPISWRQSCPGNW